MIQLSASVAGSWPLPFISSILPLFLFIVGGQSVLGLTRLADDIGDESLTSGRAHKMLNRLDFAFSDEALLLDLS